MYLKFSTGYPYCFERLKVTSSGFTNRLYFIAIDGWLRLPDQQTASLRAQESSQLFRIPLMGFTGISYLAQALLTVGGGRGPLMRPLFGQNVSENKRIGSCRGHAPGMPP